MNLHSDGPHHHHHYHHHHDHDDDGDPDGLLPLHCVVSSAGVPVEIVAALTTLYPESPEQMAIDILPAGDEYANPDTWTGDWKEKRWVSGADDDAADDDDDNRV
jgi:hypothetical protein